MEGLKIDVTFGYQFLFRGQLLSEFYGTTLHRGGGGEWGRRQSALNLSFTIRFHPIPSFDFPT